MIMLAHYGLPSRDLTRDRGSYWCTASFHDYIEEILETFELTA
jgi:hypothetical protein